MRLAGRFYKYLSGGTVGNVTTAKGARSPGQSWVASGHVWWNWRQSPLETLPVSEGEKSPGFSLHLAFRLLSLAYLAGEAGAATWEVRPLGPPTGHGQGQGQTGAAEGLRSGPFLPAWSHPGRWSLSQMEWLVSSRDLFLTVPEAGSSRSG